MNDLHDQRMAALAIGNEIRIERAKLKRQIIGGQVSVAALLLDPPAYLTSAKAFDLLTLIPHWGAVRAEKALGAAQVPLHRTVGAMTSRQRDALARRLS